MIRIDVEQAASSGIGREWLDTDGRGGYAASTLVGCHTRRYHGLMVANLRAPEGRHCLLSTLEDSLSVGNEEHFFTSHRYPGVLFPPGGSLLREFILDSCPRFTYRTAVHCLQKSVMLLRGTGALLVRYDLEGSPANGLLRLKPFLAYRGYHDLAHENPHLRSRTEAIENGFTIAPYVGMPILTIRTSAPSRFTPSPLWYNRFEYLEERARGFDWQEDLFLPGILEVPFAVGGTVILQISCDSPEEDPQALWRAETSRRRRGQAEEEALVGGCTDEDRELLLTLIRAGRQFLITTPSGRPAIIAGYPWFGSWSRDALISLPGLAFCTGRIEEGIEILTEIGRHEQEGLLPNYFSADGAPEAYNTVDSSLLYFRAVQELLRVTDDIGLIRRLFWPVMKRIIDRFLTGTRFGIGVDDRGLLQAGEEGKALTWMDAVVGGRPVTPRYGYAVEINALWYNALCFATDLARRFDDREGSFTDRLPDIRRSFRETPDVILVGEMRDLESTALAVTAAETGHLVFSTVHTKSAQDTVDRIIDQFPANQQQQIRTQLAATILAVLSQTLIARADGSGLVAGFEILLANSAVRNLIRENKTFRIDSTIQTSRDKGMKLLDDSLLELYGKGLIDRTEVLTRCRYPEEVTKRLQEREGSGQA